MPPLVTASRLDALPGTQPIVYSIPHQPRAKLGELLAGVAAGEEVERVHQQVVGQLGEVGRAAHEGGDVGHVDASSTLAT